MLPTTNRPHRSTIPATGLGSILVVSPQLALVADRAVVAEVAVAVGMGEEAFTAVDRRPWPDAVPADGRRGAGRPSGPDGLAAADGVAMGGGMVAAEGVAMGGGSLAIGSRATAGGADRHESDPDRTAATPADEAGPAGASR